MLKPWPRYSGSLKSQLDLDDDLSVEVPSRLKAVCDLYGINQSSPGWENQLLMTLLHRHVRGFQIRPSRRPKIDNAFFIEVIDGVISYIEKTTGKRPTNADAITEMLKSKADNPILKHMNPSRLIRIYSGRKQYEGAAYQDTEDAAEKLTAVIVNNIKLDCLPSDNLAKVLRAVFRDRRSKAEPATVGEMAKRGS